LIKNTDPTNAEAYLEKGGYDSHYLDKAEEAETASKILVAPGIVFPIVIPVVLPVIAIAEKRTMDEVAIKRNIEETQLLDKTIYQGGSHSGFLYFPFKDKKDINRVAGFSLNMKNIRTNEIVSFVIAIN
jgi:hypothetical protein